MNAATEVNLDPSNSVKGYMTTFSGIDFSPLHPDPKAINIYDIAHGLSCICRWGGHLKCFYSVAQHSVLVSELCSKEDQLIGLLHDAAEAYIGDMIRPIKYLKEIYEPFKAIETRVDAAIAEGLGLPSIEKTESVEEADVMVLSLESYHLRLKPGQWAIDYLNKYPALKNIKPIVPWSQELAKHKFLKRYEKLTNRIM